MNIDIGHGHQISYYTSRDDDTTHVGLIDHHTAADGSPCRGSIIFDIPQNADWPASAPKWDLISEDPLTLSPSILCRACGSHGWIRDGVWVEA